MGAVDACHKALTDIEELKMTSTPCCGGVADIAKFFAQRIREVVYTMAAYSDMPAIGPAAYKAHLEGLLLYNCIAGGVGTPHSR